MNGRAPPNLGLREDSIWFASVMKAARLPNDLLDVPPGRLIRSLRRHIGMSQRELARRVGLRQAKISLVEKEKADPRFSVVQKLLEALGCKTILLAKAGAEFDALWARRTPAGEAD